jgi:hypothetical protein
VDDLDSARSDPAASVQLSVRGEDGGGRTADADSEISFQVQPCRCIHHTSASSAIEVLQLALLLYHIMVAVTLTKKQQKAQAFRAGKGKKDRAEPEDVPEEDVLPDEEEPVPAAEESAEYKAKSKSKKSKEKKLKEKLAKGGVEGVKPVKSEKAKGKEKEVVKEGEEKGDAVEGEEKPAKKTKKDIKQRFILFVGECSPR